MAESDVDFTQYAGRVSFPRTPDDLTNTAICPACLSPLTSSVCRVCTLDLNHPAAAELFQRSTDAAAALDRRLAVIGRIRFETARLLEQQADARAALAAAATAPHAAAAATVASPVDAIIAPAPAAVAAAQAPASVAAPTVGSDESTSGTHPATPHRSSVQLVMLIVGVSLLSIAAIFFLVFAFITYGLLARSLIIGGITIAAIVVASLLPRHGLRATAEGIAVFAAILVYLDAFAVRANDLAGLGSAEGSVFWGWALVGSAVGFVLWHRASGLRVPNIIGFAALAPGIGLLVGGLADGLHSPSRYFAAFAAAAIAGLAHPLARTKAAREVAAPAKPAGTEPGRRPTAAAEAIILLVIASFALLCALVTAFAVQLDAEWGAAVALIVVALVGLAHAVVAGRASSAVRVTRVLGAIVASIGALAAALLGVAVTLRSGEPDTVLFWPVVIAAAVALVLETTTRRTAASSYSLPSAAAAISAAAVAALTLVMAVGSALLVTLAVAGSGIASPWSALATDVTAERTAFSTLTVIAIAVVLVLVAAFWVGTGLVRRRGAILLWSLAAVLVLAVPLLETLWLVVAAWLVLSAVALALLIASGGRVPLSRSLRLPIAVGGVVTLVLAYCASWLGIDSWGWATIASIVLLIIARRAPDAARPLPRAVLLGAAFVVALVGAAALARQLGQGVAFWQSSVDSLRFVGILATLVLAAACVPPRRGSEGAASKSWAAIDVSATERRTLFWIAAPAALAASGAAAAMVASTRSQVLLAELLLPEHVTSLILGLALLGALLPWAVGTRAVSHRPERVLVTLAIAPVTYSVVDAFARVSQLPAASAQLTPIVAALLVAVGSLAVSTRSTSTSPRWLRELSIAIVAVPSVLLTVIAADELAWLALLIAGVTALILAISPDSLFSSASHRRHLGWLAIVLATAGLWWRLASERVEAVEAYVLPVAAVLLLVAALLANAARTRSKTSTVAPLVGLGGLLVAILPLAINASDGPIARAYLVGGICALLLPAAAFVPAPVPLSPYLGAAGVAGALGVLITSAGRAYVIAVAPGGSQDPRRELWIGVAFLVLLLASFGLARATGPTPARSLRVTAASVVLVTAMTEVLAFEAASLTSGYLNATGLGLGRAFVTLLLFLAIYLAAALWHRAPFVRVVGWIALGFAAVIAVLAIASETIEPLEIATIPVALALIADGVVRLEEKPEARSWPTLGPGILVLLVPSLLATIDEQPLWRLVGLGVVAVAVLIVGAVRRLQAPFVLGVIVALIHGIATFSTEIRVVYEALPWWLWLGIGGVLLIAIAARYEKRIKNLKDVALRVTSLR